MIDVSQLKVGEVYDRPILAKMWGYRSHKAIERGVITPKNQSVIVLFVTKEKQEHLTQYEDHIELDVLFWEGEEKHGNDLRIISNRDKIVVFFRLRHHSPFIYQGEVKLLGFKLFSDRPSKFRFQLIDQRISELSIVEDVRSSYGLTETEKQAIIKSRIGQGVYRKDSIRLWERCSVTGFSRTDLLIASHIKPWKLSANFERLDPFNSLLLIPTLDRLFDKGFIGFENDGRILISDMLKADDLSRIGVNGNLRLRSVPENVTRYLEYHREYRFDILKRY
ncbi:MAG TPA: HNH endonuclease [Chryseosolibacter sp.]